MQQPKQSCLLLVCDGILVMELVILEIVKKKYVTLRKNQLNTSKFKGVKEAGSLYLSFLNPKGAKYWNNLDHHRLPLTRLKKMHICIYKNSHEITYERSSLL